MHGVLTSYCINYPEGQAQVELAQLRLVSSIGGTSTSTSSGRLEVYYETSSQGPGWGSVCNVRFDMVDADVACRELGFLYASGYGDLVSNYGWVWEGCVGRGELGLSRAGVPLRLRIWGSCEELWVGVGGVGLGVVVGCGWWYVGGRAWVVVPL